MKKTGVVIFTHGSKLQEANDAEVRIVAELRRRLGTVLIEPAFMELSDLTIPLAIEKLLAAGCNHIVGYALFLVPGRHLTEDIPAIFQQALENREGVTYELTAPMLDDPALMELLEKRIRVLLKSTRCVGG